MPCKLASRMFAAFAFTALVAGTTDAALAAEKQKVGVVGSISGAITAVMPGEPAALNLKVGDDIFLDETIRAGKGASAQLMFLDKSSLTVAPDTELKIDTFVYDPATSVGKMSVQGAKGTFRFIGGALSKQDAVTIKTPVSTIGIRGGIVQVSIAVDGRTAGAIFFYGRDMSVKTMGGGVSTTTEFGHGIAARSNGAVEPMKPEEVNAQVHTFNQSSQPAPDNGDANKPAPNGKNDNPNGPNGKPSDKDGKGDKSGGKPGDKGPPPGAPDSGGVDTNNSPGATTGNNTIANATNTPSLDPNNPANWGPWARNIFILGIKDPSLPIDKRVSAVTRIPLLTDDLSPLPAIYQSFGTVNYGGAVDGAVVVGANAPVPVAGTFTSQIDFNNRQITGLNINMGGFNISMGTAQSSLTSIFIGGTYNDGSVHSANGSADLGLYGVKADLLAGKFTANSSSVSTTAAGTLVGGKQ